MIRARVHRPFGTPPTGELTEVILPDVRIGARSVALPGVSVVDAGTERLFNTDDLRFDPQRPRRRRHRRADGPPRPSPGPGDGRRSGDAPSVDGPGGSAPAVVADPASGAPPPRTAVI